MPPDKTMSRGLTISPHNPRLISITPGNTDLASEGKKIKMNIHVDPKYVSK